MLYTLQGIEHVLQGIEHVLQGIEHVLPPSDASIQSYAILVRLSQTTHSVGCRNKSRHILRNLIQPFKCLNTVRQPHFK